MLPLILAPAAVIALAPAAAVQGPALEGQVLGQTGKPLPASLGLIPMFMRDEPFPTKTVENVIPKGKKGKPGFTLPIPAPGLYVLDVRARGSQPLRLPLLLTADGLKGLELSPAPEKGEAAAASPDAKVAKLAALYAAHRDREAAYRKAVKARMDKKAAGTAETGLAVDWSQDLEALSADMKNESDPDVLALAAACYLDLGAKMAKLDPETAGKALDQLPATSPWWAFNPRSAGNAFAAAGRSADWAAFRESLSKDNPDPEVRAYGLYSQLASAYNKGDKDRFTALQNTLAADYKGTKFAKSAKAFDPAKMPAPAAAPATLPETPAGEAPAQP